jgi:hypothetical protein
MPTQQQLTRLFAIATNNDWKHQQLKITLFVLMNKWDSIDSVSTKDLNETEYEQVCSLLSIANLEWMQTGNHCDLAREFFSQSRETDFNYWLDFRSLSADDGDNTWDNEFEESLSIVTVPIFEGLNNDQKTALNELIDWYHSPGKRYHLLEGYAGTGKTYLLSRFFLYLQSQLSNFKPVLSCAWHKPLKVLCHAVEDGYGNEYVSATLYSLFGLRLELNETDGKNMIIDSQSQRINLSDHDLLVDDECGINDDTLLSKLQGSPIKTLFMGDRWQLPPVGSEMSPLFDWVEKSSTGVSRLRIIERYDPDSGLGKAVNYCVSCLENDDVFYPSDLSKFVDDKTLIKVTAKQLDIEILALIAKGEYDKDLHIALSFSNASVIKLNSLIRDQLVTTDWEYLSGEEIIFNEPLMSGESLIYANGDRCDITSVVACEVDGLHCLRITLPAYLPSGRNAAVAIVRSASMAEYSRELTRLEGIAMQASSQDRRRAWGRYHGYRLNHYPVRHTFASTIHKSQGSTYDAVFAKMGGISRVKELSNEMVCRLWYVALSRAKNKAIYSM